ncbi:MULTISPECIES: FAD-dependent oxidoreductase [Caulobacter]|jgi:NADH dehydrogenase|uniref:NADH dehydrogenase, FAD-containing subunit n=1 Tax=Caulobacter vibrioides OR37 TaxID=1292034 RepID=R0D593_CAUVI|nr:MULTISPECIES: FAD-dependent oxidoreductase [Caulobacter]ENZ83711.1 NADH dehydrogenase, FAD-containing subunit [Caulobacter vibrioides OR37]MBQ1560912.1 FAD-dependent oxidoreductase [Caulobacter sp.]HXH47339.1 FAD-dependent oxidoreductase [Bradyrhizobium sp.]
MHYDIVIVGGGAGGLELASRLGRRLGGRRIASHGGKRRVLLIDRSSFHIWKPTLHEVAAGTLDVHQEGVSYSILGRSNGFNFLLGELATFDPGAKRLTLKAITDQGGQVLAPERTITFTYGVLAIGSGSNLFGTPGAEQAYLLERTEDAEVFHARLLAAFTRASFSTDKIMRVAIVGGGATGVELSAELIEAHRELLGSLGDEQRFRLDITVVEAAERILGGLPPEIADKAKLALERKGVAVKTDAKVLAVHADRLETSRGDVLADLIVWAAGVKAAEANRGFGLETNRGNQFVVNDRLETSSPDIWALGDCAAAPWKDGKTVPARAQAAHQQASYLERVLIARLRQGHVQTPFVYRDFGSLVSLGDNKGVGALMGGLGGPNFFIEGLLAKWAYMSLHLDHHRAILGVGRTATLAIARLLQQRVSGRLKLH